MKNVLNIDSTTQFPTVWVLTAFAALIIIGCLTYWKWEMRGFVIYIGIIVTVVGMFMIYMGIVDKTL